MPAFKSHVAAMRESLHPALVALFGALHQPSPLISAAAPQSVSAGVDTLFEAAHALRHAAENLNRRVFIAESCSEGTRIDLSHKFNRSVRDLIAAYAGALHVLEDVPRARSAALERAARANLERVAMWLADILTTLADPELLLYESGDDGTPYSKEYLMQLTFPESESELDGRIEKPTGYDARLVRDALANASRAPVSPPLRSATPAPARRTGDMGVLGWIGLMALGAWIFGDDDCDHDL